MRVCFLCVNGWLFDADRGKFRFANDDEPAILTPLSTAKEWVVGPAPSKAGTEPLQNQRWMHEMTMCEFYDVYVGTCEGQPASMSSFTRAWFRGGWDHKIKFRPVGTHSAGPH